VNIKSWRSSVSIVTISLAGRPEFNAGSGRNIFLFVTASILALGPFQPPIQWVPGALSPRFKRPGREADHSPPSRAKVKNAWSYTFKPPYVFMVWGLVKHRDNFNFYLYFIYALNNQHLKSGSKWYAPNHYNISNDECSYSTVSIKLTFCVQNFENKEEKYIHKIQGYFRVRIVPLWDKFLIEHPLPQW